MNHLYYTALDIACILFPLNLGIRDQDQLVDTIWVNDCNYLSPIYHTNKRRFKQDVKYWCDYLCDKPALDAEYPFIQKDFKTKGLSLEKEQVINDVDNLDLFFKSVRLKICYMDKQDYIRIKLRTLLKMYGYKRRSQKLMEHIQECLDFYKISTYYAGKVPCNISESSIEDILIFRLVS